MTMRTSGSSGEQVRDVGTVIDVESERARTTGCQTRHHFNSAGAGLPSDAVVDAMVAHLRSEQLIGGYEAATKASGVIDRLYRDTAELLGANSSEIAFFDSATTGLRVVFDALRLAPGDTVLASRSTYVSQALRLLSLRRDFGVSLVTLPNDATGVTDLEALEAALDAATGRVVISGVHIPTSSGAVEPVVEIGALAKRYGASYILDATQSVGQLAVDVRRIGCDVVVSTGRKFLRGPRGTALLYASSGFLARLDPWAPDVRGSVWNDSEHWTVADTAKKLETWEASVAGRIGLGVAVAEALARGVTATEAHLVELGSKIRKQLAAIPGVAIADPPSAASAIVTFSVEGVSDGDVSAKLREHRIDTIAIPAHHAQWDLGARDLVSVVRASAHVYNDDADIDALIDAVARLAEGGG